MQRLPVQSPLPSPSPRPPRMFSDWPSQYMKAVSSSLWPRSRKARTVAALALASMRRPISMVPSTVAGRRGAPEAVRDGRGSDMARGRTTEGPERRAHTTAARPTARDAERSMETALAHSKPQAPPTARGAGHLRGQLTPAGSDPEAETGCGSCTGEHEGGWQQARAGGRDSRRTQPSLSHTLLRLCTVPGAGHLLGSEILGLSPSWLGILDGPTCHLQVPAFRPLDFPGPGGLVFPALGGGLAALAPAAALSLSLRTRRVTGRS